MLEVAMFQRQMPINTVSRWQHHKSNSQPVIHFNRQSRKHKMSKITLFRSSCMRFDTIFTQLSVLYNAYERRKHRPFGGITHIKTAKMAAPVRQAWPTLRIARICFQYNLRRKLHNCMPDWSVISRTRSLSNHRCTRTWTCAIYDDARWKVLLQVDACTTAYNALDFLVYLPKIRIVSVVLFHAKRQLFTFSHKRTLLQSQFNYISQFSAIFNNDRYPCFWHSRSTAYAGTSKHPNIFVSNDSNRKPITLILEQKCTSKRQWLIHNYKVTINSSRFVCITIPERLGNVIQIKRDQLIIQILSKA